MEEYLAYNLTSNLFNCLEDLCHIRSILVIIMWLLQNVLPLKFLYNISINDSDRYFHCRKMSTSETIVVINHIFGPILK
jgi:hypothetical protein